MKRHSNGRRAADKMDKRGLKQKREAAADRTLGTLEGTEEMALEAQKQNPAGRIPQDDI